MIVATTVIVAGSVGPRLQETTAGGTGVSNLWIAPTAGASPQRCSPQCQFDATKAYGSMVAACAAAQSGDLVTFRGGEIYSTGETLTSANCDKSAGSVVTFHAESGAEFRNTWRLGDKPNTLSGPKNIRLTNWSFRRNVSAADDLFIYEVNDVQITGLVIQGWEVEGDDTESDPPDSDLIIDFGDFGNCDGDGSKGLYSGECITRVGHVGGVDLIGNNWWGYGGGSNCVPGGTPGCARGVALFFPVSGFSNAKTQDIRIERNKWWGSAVTDIRFQARDTGTMRRFTIINNMFLSSAVSEASISMDTPTAMSQFTVVGNTFAHTIGTGGTEFSSPQTWPDNSVSAGNIFRGGGPGSSVCDNTLMTYRYNLRYRSSETSGAFVCDATEILAPWTGSVSVGQFIVSASECNGSSCAAANGLPEPDGTLLASTLANNAWPAADCTSRITGDFFGATRPIDSNCDIGGDERDD